MSSTLHGRTALITASSEGLGLASAIKIAQAGARVAICGRDPTKLVKAKRAIDEASGHESSIAITADLTKAGDIERLVAETLRELGKIEIMVVNSGHMAYGTVEDLEEGAWYDAFELLLMSAVRLTRLVLPHMRRQNIGDIAYITAAGVREPSPQMVLSNAFRAGVSAMAKTVARAAAADNIRINVLAPGYFNTGRMPKRIDDVALREKISRNDAARRIAMDIPMGRFGEAEELAALVAFVVGRESRYLTGSTIVIDGGVGHYAF